MNGSNVKMGHSKSARRRMNRAVLSWTAAIAAALGCVSPEEDAREAPAGVISQAYTSGQNQLADGGFESGTSGFVGASGTVTVTRTTTSPIAGAGSLQLGLPGWGSTAYWLLDFPWNSGTFAQTFAIAAKVKVTSGQAGAPISVCALGYYQDAADQIIQCQDVDAGTRDVRDVTASIALDPARQLDRVYFWVRLNGNGPATLLVDQASAALFSSTPPVDPPAGGQELLPDGSFESAAVSFEVQGASTTVQRSTTTPIAGTASLRASFGSWGAQVYHLADFPWNSGTTGSSLRLRASVRIDSGTAGVPVAICPVAYYQDSAAEVSTCRDLDAGNRAVQAVDLTTPLDGNRELDRVYFRMRLNGTAPVVVTVDSASLLLASASGNPGTGGASGTGGATGTGGTAGTGGTSTGGAGGTGGGPAGTRTWDVVLRPHASVVGSTARVSFGLPLPPGVLTDASRITVQTTSGQAIAAFTRALAPWRAMPPPLARCSGVSGATPGVRSVLVQFDRTFTTAADQTVRLIVNAAPASSLPAETPVASTFRVVNEGTFTSAQQVQEPRVHALLPRELLACAGIGTLTARSGRTPAMAATDQAQLDFFGTAVNQFYDWPVEPQYRTDFVRHYEAWLFDRPQTFWNGHVRSGNFDMLREAFRMSHYYLGKIFRAGQCPAAVPATQCAGYFSLRSTADDPSKDEKYSYNEAMWTYYLLSGRSEPFDMINTLAVATRYGDSLFDVAQFPATATNNGGFTERNAGNGLLADVVDYEASGTTAARDRVSQAITRLRGIQQTPGGGVPFNGCFNYRGPDWETEYGFSPWMSSILAHALVRAYQATAHPDVPRMLVDLAQCLVQRGIYTTAYFGPSYDIPFYGGASTGTPRDLDGWPERQIEHAIDVAHVIAMGAVFTTDATQRAAFLAKVRNLLLAHEYNIGNWTRDTAGRPRFRLSNCAVDPAVNYTIPELTALECTYRKYQWYYHNTGGVEWALGGPMAL